MDLGIAGKWALVCGASKGLGFGCAQALVREGVNVVINARNPDTLQQAASKLIAASADISSARGQNGLKPVVLAVAADITTPEGRTAVFSASGGPGHDFDIVVTNAGGPPAGDFRDWERADWLRAIDANMLTPIELIKATVDRMAARGFGRVVNITSSAVKEPMNVLGLSNGARSGLTGFIAGLARSKIAAQGVTINNLLPGKFATERLGVTFEAMGAADGVSGEQIRQRHLEKIPAHRLGTPEEFGAICAFLCSVHAGFITGQNVLADGGAYPGTF